jgi:hypothetical protein
MGIYQPSGSHYRPFSTTFMTTKPTALRTQKNNDNFAIRHAIADLENRPVARAAKKRTKANVAAMVSQVSRVIQVIASSDYWWYADLPTPIREE